MCILTVYLIWLDLEEAWSWVIQLWIHMVTSFELSAYGGWRCGLSQRLKLPFQWQPFNYVTEQMDTRSQDTFGK